MGEELRRWLVGWIDKHPLRHFCYLRTEICRAEAADVVRREKLADWLFILAMDCRLSFLNCGCTGCEPDAGVPLARVWLQSDDERWGRENCRVVFIDPYPPFRRPVRPDCWPAPLGSINAGRAIWHRAEEACTMLSDLGVRLREPAEMFKPAELADLAELETRLSCDPFIACGEQRTPLVFDAGPLGLRVVGFCATNAPKPEPPPPPPPPPPPQGEIVPSIKLMKFTNTGATVETTEVTPNDRVQYVFRVRNETGGGLTAVDLFDEQTGSGEGAIEVDSGKTFETKSSVVSASKLRTTGDDNKIINVLTVEGLDASNQLFKKMATSEAKLVLTPNPAGVDTTKPPAVAKPARRDDFTILSGISEARSSALHDAGINTFAELAAAPVERLREITSTSEKVVLQWIKTARETA
jgi:predicted flap endonuclease-1-like 5' DNA nuclease